MARKFEDQMKGRNWVKVPKGKKPAVLRQVFARHIDERLHETSFGELKTSYDGVFSPYGPGNVVDVVFNNQYHHPERVLGFHISDFGNEHEFGNKSRWAQVTFANLFDGVKMHERGNFVTVRVREFAQGAWDFSMKERLLRFSFDVINADWHALNGIYNRTLTVSGNARLLSHGICEGLSTISDERWKELTG